MTKALDKPAHGLSVDKLEILLREHYGSHDFSSFPISGNIGSILLRVLQKCFSMIFRNIFVAEALMFPSSPTCIYPLISRLNMRRNCMQQKCFLVCPHWETLLHSFQWRHSGVECHEPPRGDLLQNGSIYEIQC